MTDSTSEKTRPTHTDEKNRLHQSQASYSRDDYNALPELQTKRCWLVSLTREKAVLIYRYYLDNLEHLYRWDNPASANAFTLETWQDYALWAQDQYHSGQQIEFIALNSEQTTMLALCSFTAIRAMPFASCELGFSIASNYEGQGIMHEVLTKAIDYVFEQHDIQRIVATHHPKNQRSANLLARLGFETEGIAKSYKKVGENWEDQVVTALIKPIKA